MFIQKKEKTENLLDPRYLNHPFEVWGVNPVPDEPVRELVPLVGVAAINGQTGLSILVLGFLEIIGYFLVFPKIKSSSNHQFSV